MPLINSSGYKHHSWWKNGHMTTILTALFRDVPGVKYSRERFELTDGDFIDLDWLKSSSEKLVILLHGLEGNASSGYLKGMAKRIHQEGWSVLAINFRSCSGEPNRKYRSYHSGETNDLQQVIDWVIGKLNFQRVALVGFSLGGNVLLKYLGEKGKAIAPQIIAAAAISVPCDLQASVDQLKRFTNKVYQQHFLKALKRKLIHKASFEEATFTRKQAAQVSNLQEFDDLYTAPAHGFKDAADYYSRSSCKKYLSGIGVPTLLINAQDDPFLAPECYPIEEAFSHRYLHLEMPAKGGHIGFLGSANSGSLWHENRVVEFFWQSGFDRLKPEMERKTLQETDQL